MVKIMMNQGIFKNFYTIIRKYYVMPVPVFIPVLCLFNPNKDHGAFVLLLMPIFNLWKESG